jgi:hypothetical protein
VRPPGPYRRRSVAKDAPPAPSYGRGVFDRIETPVPSRLLMSADDRRRPASEQLLNAPPLPVLFKFGERALCPDGPDRALCLAVPEWPLAAPPRATRLFNAREVLTSADPWEQRRAGRAVILPQDSLAPGHVPSRRGLRPETFQYGLQADPIVILPGREALAVHQAGAID